MIQLRYFVDPMCSWCWGFAPVVQQLSESGQYQMDMVMGGLRAGEQGAMTDELRNYVLHHWQQVQQTTGQAFAFDGALPAGFVYNTEPACRAVVAVRELEPERALAYLHAVQQAFYAEARDVTQAGVLASLADAQGIAEARFLQAFEAPETSAATQADFARKAEFGVMGFPCVLVNTGARWRMVSMGYQDFDTVRQQIDRRIARDNKQAKQRLH